MATALLAAGDLCAQSSLASVVFGGVDISTRSTFVSSGGKISYPLAGDTHAFVLTTAGISLSDYKRYRREKIDALSVASEARIFFGLERGLGKVHVAAGLGPSLNTFSTRQGIGRRRIGAAAIADVWYRPSETDGLNVTMVADTGPRSFWTRLRYGQKVSEFPLIIGPEASFSRTLTSRKYRAGFHISELLIGRMNIALAGGWMRENGKTGPYSTISMYMKY